MIPQLGQNVNDLDIDKINFLGQVDYRYFEYESELGTLGVESENSKITSVYILESLKNKLRVKSIGGKIPTKAHKTDEGYDLYSNENVVIRPGETVKVHTGICLGLPEGYWAKIFDRSSVGSQGLLVNAGVIDNSYTGEVIVCMTNLSNGTEDDTFIITKGDKIAQFVLMRHNHKDIVEVNSLEETERGEKGFGSSGK